jgi:sugar (pentulose or hexulose) kinase
VGAGVPESAIIVLDIGKTHAKLTLWDRSGTLVVRRTRANAHCLEGGLAVLDVHGIEGWLTDTLRDFSGLAKIGAIIPVAHGAAAAIIRDSKLIASPTDYEAPIAPDVRTAYDALRSPFGETGSPALPDGLNLGAQLFQAGICAPDLILLWPQYWSWLLSGVASSEVTSLGCHTDMWNPTVGRPSQMAIDLGWSHCLPPLRSAGSVLGPISPDWVRRTGLPADTQIHCGIHDSNAALVAARGFPELADTEFSLLSTGTWFIALKSSGRSLAESFDISIIPEARDCLINVDAEGRPVPSARWMGGREIASLAGQIDVAADQAAMAAAVPAVLQNDIMLLPSFAPGVGPFPTNEGCWINRPENEFERRATICLYAALVTDASLDLIGARGAILIEGRFAGAEVFVRALPSLRPENIIYTASAENDVSFGALRLVHPQIRSTSSLTRVQPLNISITNYQTRWIAKAFRGATA